MPHYTSASSASGAAVASAGGSVAASASGTAVASAQRLALIGAVAPWAFSSAGFSLLSCSL
eukprot:7784126-Lingulodinium_polyedra.AAC.1